MLSLFQKLNQSNPTLLADTADFFKSRTAVMSEALGTTYRLDHLSIISQKTGLYYYLSNFGGIIWNEEEVGHSGVYGTVHLTHRVMLLLRAMSYRFRSIGTFLLLVGAIAHVTHYSHEAAGRELKNTNFKLSFNLFGHTRTTMHSYVLLSRFRFHIGRLTASCFRPCHDCQERLISLNRNAYGSRYLRY